MSKKNGIAAFPHGLLENLETIRKHNISHIALNALTDGCVLSGVASTVLVWPMEGNLGSLARYINMAGVGSFLFVRGIAEYKKTRMTEAYRAFLEGHDAGMPGAPGFYNLKASQKDISRQSELIRWLGVGWENFLYLVNDKSQFLVQPAFQLAAAIVTTSAFLNGAHSPDVVRIAEVFAFNFVGNILVAREKPRTTNIAHIARNQGKPAAVLMNMAYDTRKFFEQLVLNPYLYWAVAFDLAGNTQSAHALLPQVANLSYGLAVAHTVVTAVPKLATGFDEFMKKHREKLFGPVLSFIRQKDFPVLLFAGGCFAAMAQNMVHADTFKTGVMAFYASACLSIYALQRWGGVSELVDLVAKGDRKPERPSAKPALASSPEEPPLV